MTAEEWNKAKALFDAALALAPSQRAPFLAQNCPDESLRREVEKLLLNFHEAGSFLSRPALHPHTPESMHISQRPEDGESPSLRTASESPLAPATTVGPDDPMIGRHLGAYRLERRVGQGGMAAVFLAARADGEFRHQVAIKLVLPGSERDEILERFRKERQTLAGLDHPNIVKLLDGGSTPEGLPYLVMDYVEGSPLDGYCDSHKLSVDQRLRLFIKICEAVQHAHQKRIIHRDLKPANILVTGHGVPKLLDFGIAKVLESAALPVLTQTGARCMTPAYASPEQVRGKPVTTASDVYSLGVVLYELLTGHLPYRLKEHTSAEIERVICEQEPENPSTAVNRVEAETSSDGTRVTKTPETVSETREGQPDRLRRRLRGDLDNIVLKVLQKDPERRYKSVEEFARDIEGHLRHLPVKARRSTVPYRISRLIRRHSIAASIALGLVLVPGAAVWLTFRVAGLRERARLTKKMQPVAAPHRPVNLTALDAYLHGNYYLTDTPEKPTGRPDEGLRKAGEYFQRAIDADPTFARAYVGLSNAYSFLWWRSEEDFNIMRGAAEKAVNLDPNSSEARVQLADARVKDWDWSGAEDECRRAIALNPNSASAHICLAEVLDQQGEMDEGWKEHEIAQQLDPDQDHLSLALYLRGQYDQAIDLLRRLVESHRDDPASHWYLSLASMQKGNYEESVQEMGKGLRAYGLSAAASRVQGAFVSSGWRGALFQWIKELDRFNAEKRIYDPGLLAEAYVQLGDKDRALYWLEQGRAHRHSITFPVLICNVRVDPSFAPLRSDPRFNQFLRRAGLIR